MIILSLALPLVAAPPPEATIDANELDAIVREAFASDQYPSICAGIVHGDELVCDGLRDTETTHAPGEDLVYSNLGMGMLRHLASVAAQRPQDALLEEELLDPLGGKPGTLTCFRRGNR